MQLNRLMEVLIYADHFFTLLFPSYRPLNNPYIPVYVCKCGQFAQWQTFSNSSINAAVAAAATATAAVFVVVFVSFCG